MSKACSTHRKEEIFILGFTGNLKERKPIRPRCRWNNTKMQLNDNGWVSINWIQLDHYKGQ
jgi:hypothetical protein